MTKAKMSSRPANNTHPASCFLAFLLLLSLLCNSRLLASKEDDAAYLSQDRPYLESSCPMDGIQELILRKNGEFELTSYIEATNTRKPEFRGHWLLQDTLLRFDWADQSMTFQTKSVVHNFIREKFLFLSFKAMPGKPGNPLDNCEFVDRRVLDRFLSPGNK